MSAKYTLLLVDDDREMLEITARSFQEAGYTVHTAENAAAGLGLVGDVNPDCVILDVMMPGMDGFEACRRLRETSGVPVIFLTGREAEDDKVDGLLLGADDYVVKPHSFRELEARVRILLRRAAVPVLSSSPDSLVFPPLEIDIVGHRVLCDGEDLYLTSREYDILYLLAHSEGEVVTYEDIGLQLWGSYRPADRSSVMVGVSRLRKKLEGSPVASAMIETVWTTGYKFTGKRAGK
jgi:DNA-binding response OmpR family regulator